MWIEQVAITAFSRPPLTTVRIPKYDTGVVAMQKLHRLIREESEIPVQSVVYSDLIVRESCIDFKYDGYGPNKLQMTLKYTSELVCFRQLYFSLSLSIQC